MGKIIEDVWILFKDGLVIFTYSVNSSKINEQLFGGLISALKSLSEAIAEKGLSSFELGGKRFTIKKRRNILFVASSSKQTSEEKVDKELNILINRFFSNYSKKHLDNWKNDTSQFSDFREKIRDILEDPVSQFMKNLSSHAA